MAALLDAVPAGRGAVQSEYEDGNDRAPGFYAAHGFRELRHDPDPCGPWPDTVWMQRDL